MWFLPTVKKQSKNKDYDYEYVHPQRNTSRVFPRLDMNQSMTLRGDYLLTILTPPLTLKLFFSS